MAEQHLVVVVTAWKVTTIILDRTEAQQHRDVVAPPVRHGEVGSVDPVQVADGHGDRRDSGAVRHRRGE